MQKDDSPQHPKAHISDARTTQLVKVTVPTPPVDRQESIYRRVAKFLLLIGVDEAAKVISHLGEDQTEKIIPEIATIKRVDAAEASAILDEFSSLLQRSREAGGVDAARTILEKAFGADKAEAVIDKAVPFPQGVPFEYLHELDGERVYLLLHDESLEVRCLVLSHLKPALSAAVIQRMKPDEKTDVVKRLAKITAVSPEVVKRVDEQFHAKVLHANTSRLDTMNGTDSLAEILKRMDPRDEQSILASLSRDEPALAETLRERLFTVDDIIASDDKFIQTQLRAMEDEDVVLLIAGKPENFRSKILANVSKGRGDRLLEDEQLNKPFRREDCSRVSAEFFSKLRRAWEEGKLLVEGRMDGEYVE
jgi:flagellar motor switch protein FliG